MLLSFVSKAFQKGLLKAFMCTVLVSISYWKKLDSVKKAKYMADAFEELMNILYQRNDCSLVFVFDQVNAF